jgi:hypothetical protein
VLTVPVSTLVRFVVAPVKAVGAAWAPKLTASQPLSCQADCARTSMAVDAVAASVSAMMSDDFMIRVLA